MIRFNELGISNDGKYLIIDASVRTQHYYDNVFIDSFSIDTQDTYKDGGPSSSIVYHKDFRGRELKHFRVALGVGDFLPSLSDNMFFVYIKAKGAPTIDTPCCMDNIYTLGVTFNTCPLYNTIMGYIRETEAKCSVPKNFINLFLQFKALEMCINTDHYAQAIEYYNKYIKGIGQGKKIISYKKPCNCHG